MTGVKKNFLKLTLDKSHFITENKRRRNLIKTEIADVFMNPVRQRIIQ